MSRPTGRSGRLRLTRQLEAARRGAELLERKRRILAGELERLRLVTARSAEEWSAAGVEATRWAVRAQAIDGAQHLADAADPSVVQAAVVEVSWQAAMGVVYPGEIAVRPGGGRPTGGSSAMVLAARAHRVALTAAARHAAADRALQLVSAELEATRLRQQAIERRWLPRLEDQLRRLTMQLDELEREEHLRLRWAAGARRDGRAG